LYPTKLFFLIEGKIKTFHGKQKQKEFMISKPVQQRYLEEVCIEKRKKIVSRAIQE
jgi:hypothetical protein